MKKEENQGFITATDFKGTVYVAVKPQTEQVVILREDSSYSFSLPQTPLLDSFTKNG